MVAPALARPFRSRRHSTLTNSTGATIAAAPGSAAPNPGGKRASAVGTGWRHASNPRSKAKAAGTDHSDGDGLANALICIAVMLACVMGYILVARTFMA
jgi:hypothetical protein